MLLSRWTGREADVFGRRRLTCSFCGKGEAAMSKLVAGPRVLPAP
ncbi:MAG: hypothetical protein IMZ55_02540 [Acidobacteria bacterium]|nr:hypothetical protein [Planctomycetota bacterium]MBE3132324.1 hypothetical protein [Acidobacteriota bacterium]